jgi:solute carrier family 25 S-adenosylmethionine transporter 26
MIFPLDTLKTRLQSPAYQQTYRSASAIASKALRRNLYQGVGTVLLITVPSSGVFFTTYEGLKHVLGGSSWTAQGLLPLPAVHALSSCGAQLVNCAVVTPAEVLKQNAQMLAAKAPGRNPRDTRAPSMSATMTVLRQLRHHPTKLWRGYTALAARDIPFTALQFPAFEYMKRVLLARRSRAKGGRAVGVLEQSWIAAISAGVAGSAAAWLTTPLDVVKTRMMLEAGDGERSQRAGEMIRKGGRRSAFAVGKDVLHREGLRGMFRGGLIRAGVTILGNGLYMGCYEGAKLYLVKEEE